MRTIFIFLVLILITHTILKYTNKKFGRKIMKRLILISFPLVYAGTIIFLFFTDQKNYDPIIYFVGAPTVITIIYALCILLPLFFIYAFRNYLALGGLKTDYESTLGHLFYEVSKGFKYFVTNPIKDPTGHQSWLWTLSKIISLVLTPVVIYFIYEGYLILYQLFGDFVVNILNEQAQDFRLIKNPFVYLIGFVWFCIIIFWAVVGLLGLIGGLFRIISLFIFNLLR